MLEQCNTPLPLVKSTWLCMVGFGLKASSLHTGCLSNPCGLFKGPGRGLMRQEWPLSKYRVYKSRAFLCAVCRCLTSLSDGHQARLFQTCYRIWTTLCLRSPFLQLNSIVGFRKRPAARHETGPSSQLFL